MFRKRNLIIGAVMLAVVLTVGLTNYSFAASKIGEVTGRDGDVKDKVQINAEIVAVDGSHLTFKDLDTSKEYKTGVGPSWFSGTYNVGDKLTIEGVEATGQKAQGKDQNFQVMKINDKILRENFESKPAWAGQRQNKQNGTGDGQGQRQRNFIDADGDGTCDNKN